MVLVVGGLVRGCGRVVGEQDGHHRRRGSHRARVRVISLGRGRRERGMGRLAAAGSEDQGSERSALICVQAREEGNGARGRPQGGHRSDNTPLSAL